MALASTPTIDKSSTSLWKVVQPWVVVFTAALFFFFDFIQMNMFNALDPDLIRAFHVNAIELGHLSANYFYGNVLFLFPAGLILDRVSTRKALLVTMSVLVGCTVGFAFSKTLWQGELFRFITGLAGAFCMLSCVRLASRWFPPQRMALVIGLVVTFAMTGGMLAQKPFTVLTEHYGWRNTLFADAIFGFIMLVAMQFIVKDYPSGDRDKIKAQQHQLHDLGFWLVLKQAASNLQNWLAGMTASLLNLPIFLLGALWGSMYLTQVRGLSRDVSTEITMMIFLGTIIGSPIVGFISDKLRRRKLPMMIGALLSIVFMLMLIYMPRLSVFDLMAIFFIIGFTTSTQIIAYPLIAESNPAMYTATAESLSCMLIMSGGFMQPVFARLMDIGWRPHFVNGIPIYSGTNYDLAMLMMPAAFFLALLATLVLKESYCRPYESEKDVT
jgi:MFS family permease